MKIKMMMLALALFNCEAYAQHDHTGHDAKKTEQASATFKDAKVGAAYEHYIHLKDALVASNSDEAKKAASDLQKSLANVSAGKKAFDEAVKIAATSDLDEQREVFSNLSNEMKSLVRKSKLTSGMLYLAFCPMANNHEGAYWLSNEKQIKNPYFGDAMLKCGSVKETIQ